MNNGCFFCSIVETLTEGSVAAQLVKTPDLPFITAFVMGMDMGARHKHFSTAVNHVLDNMTCSKHASYILDDVRARGETSTS